MTGLQTDSKRTPAAVLKLAHVAFQMGAIDRAFALYEEVLQIAPENSVEAISAQRRIVLSVPDWHARMMHDQHRNGAYDEAIRRAIKPGMRVFEIGTGAGLLAMMAARAGAAHVYTCEMNPAVAEVAREIVIRNGFADRITVLSRHSRDVKPEDLGGPVDLLISEIVDDSILGEGVLPAHEAAIPLLLKPGGQVIPARGIVRAALVSTRAAETSWLDHIDGFDVRAFRKFLNHRNKAVSGDKVTRMASDPVDLFRFDLSCPNRVDPAQTTVSLRARGGAANAVARWIALDLDEHTRYENAPDANFRSCWEIPLEPLAKPILLAPDDHFVIHASHDRAGIIVWV